MSKNKNHDEFIKKYKKFLNENGLEGKHPKSININMGYEAGTQTSYSWEDTSSNNLINNSRKSIKEESKIISPEDSVEKKIKSIYPKSLEAIQEIKQYIKNSMIIDATDLGKVDIRKEDIKTICEEKKELKKILECRPVIYRQYIKIILEELNQNPSVLTLKIFAKKFEISQDKIKSILKK